MLMRRMIVSLMLLLPLVAAAQDTLQVGTPQVIHDTVYIYKDAPAATVRQVKQKKYGRYDRRISNYLVLPKGKWISGMTLSFYQFDANDSRALFSLLKDLNFDFKMQSVHPFVGYSVGDNQVVGVKLSYSNTSTHLENLSLKVEDVSLGIKNIAFTNKSYAFNLFHRSYVGIDGKGLFGVYNETILGYKTGQTHFERATDDGVLSSETTTNAINLKLQPGLSLQIMKNVYSELSFSVAGFNYSWERQKKSTGEKGSRDSSGANFKLNLLDINIGLTIGF